jgi:hypothetical protein
MSIKLIDAKVEWGQYIPTTYMVNIFSGQNKGHRIGMNEK